MYFDVLYMHCSDCCILSRIALCSDLCGCSLNNKVVAYQEVKCADQGCHMFLFKGDKEFVIIAPQ